MPELKDTKRSLFDHVFEGIFSSALNDPEIEDLVGKLEKEDNSLVDMVSTTRPVGIGAEVQTI